MRIGLRRAVTGSVAGCLFIFAFGCRSAPAPPLKPAWTNYEINASVFAMAFEGNTVWVGTDIGLIQYDLLRDEIVARYNSQNGLVSDIVTTVKIDPEGNKWVGTHGAGLSRFDGRNWKNFTTRDGLAGNFISDILVDSDDTLYIATDGGVSVFKAGRWSRYTTAGRFGR